jgi:hypothetical protein
MPIWSSFSFSAMKIHSLGFRSGLWDPLSDLSLSQAGCLIVYSICSPTVCISFIDRRWNFLFYPASYKIPKYFFISERKITYVRSMIKIFDDCLHMNSKVYKNIKKKTMSNFYFSIFFKKKTLISPKCI